MPDKKSALKPATKAAPAKKAPPPARREPASKKEAPKPVKAKANGKAAPAPKAAPIPAKAAKTPAPAPKAAAKKVEAKVAPKPAAKVEAKGKAAPKVETKAAPKVDPKAKAAAKAAPEAKAAKAPEMKQAAKAKAAPEPKASKAAPAPKPEKPPKAAKAPKPPKPPKPEKPPKLAPVAAALAKPMLAKPLAVAAGRAQPVLRSQPTPAPKLAPKPLVAPKPTAEPETAGELQDVPTFKAKTAGAKGMVMVGAIAGAFGVKGEVRLRAFTAKTEGVISYGPLYGEDGKLLLKPKSWRSLKDGVAVVAAEVKSREQAEAMRGQKLFVPRANLPAPAADEFYVVDLLGSRAEALDGTVLGDIVAVWNFGAGDILEYRPPDGSPNVRVTFTKETVPHVDLPAKRVVIDPPAPEPVGK